MLKASKNNHDNVLIVGEVCWGNSASCLIYNLGFKWSVKEYCVWKTLPAPRGIFCMKAIVT